MIIKNCLVLLMLLLLAACSNTVENSPKDLTVKDSIETTTSTTKHIDASFSMPKTKKMMAENSYWALIEKAKKSSDDLNMQADFLQKELEQMTAEDIIGFRLRTDKLMAETYTSDMWCAAYIANQGASDDGFEYFRLWLIAQGKEVFMKVKSRPDNLVNYAQPGAELEFEPFWYVALNAFSEKTGHVLYDYIDNSFAEQEGYYKPITFTWKEEEPETMRKICPRLFAKFMK